MAERLARLDQLRRRHASWLCVPRPPWPTDYRRLANCVRMEMLPEIITLVHGRCDEWAVDVCRGGPRCQGWGVWLARDRERIVHVQPHHRNEAEAVAIAIEIVMALTGQEAADVQVLTWDDEGVSEWHRQVHHGPHSYWRPGGMSASRLAELDALEALEE